MSRDEKLVDLEGVKRGETEKAIRIVVDGKSAWIPKRYVEENDDGTFTMPEWIAIDKELV